VAPQLLAMELLQLQIQEAVVAVLAQRPLLLVLAATAVQVSSSSVTQQQHLLL
jgi:hypothetical protein